MAVHTSIFGAVKLSGEDAKKFNRQVAFGRPKKAAAEALKKGNKLLRQYDKKGYIELSIKAK